MDVEQYKVKPEEWGVIRAGWRNGAMDIDFVIWYLLGYHPAIDKHVFVGDVLAEKYDSLKRALHNEDDVFFEVSAKDKDDYFWADMGKRSRRSFIAVDRDALVKAYEKNSSLGRPPFLFADVQQQEALPTVGRWPWGTYETKLLRDLAAAVNKFFVLFNPDEPDTAKTNEVVSEWLQKERGLSKNIADAIASIIRPENLPRGRR